VGCAVGNGVFDGSDEIVGAGVGVLGVGTWVGLCEGVAPYANPIWDNNNRELILIIIFILIVMYRRSLLLEESECCALVCKK
jgi:hypothetical protein